MRFVFISWFICLCSSYIFSQNEPAHQPVDLTFSTIRAYNFTMGFQPSQADGFLVLKSTEPVTFIPQDGIVYENGQGVANAKVLSSGSATSFIVKEVAAHTTYHFAIFAYNGSGNNINYKQDNPLTGNIISVQADYGNYYDGLDADAADFLVKLSERLHNHTHVAYNSYGNLVVSAIFERDTVNGAKVVTCEYSGENKIYSSPFGFQNTGYSREHIMSRSWMPTGGDFATPEGADYHNLALTNQNNANNLRSNYPLGKVVTPTSVFLDCKLGKDENNITVFEPADNMKGNAARAIFYQILCYNGVGGNNWGFYNLPNNRALEQNLDILINWHFSDLPDAFEKAKHEYIYTLQNNRNVFIDFPELADCIDFNQILKSGQCVSAISTEDLLLNKTNISVYPNPTTNLLNIEVKGADTSLKIESVKLLDITGKEAKSFKNISSGIIFSEDISDVNNGSYFLNILFSNGVSVMRNIVVQ